MIESYYNQLAPFYRYLFPDWERALFACAGLDSVIQEFFGPQVRRILDAACGAPRGALWIMPERH